MNCQNCGSRLSCGCQKRTASDGKQCCSKCITAYEHGLIKKNIARPKTNTEPIITKIIQK